MITRTIRASVIALAALAAPVALTAQQTPVPEQAPVPAPQQQQELQGWLAEMQQIQSKLADLQIKALEDTALQAEQEALGTEIQAAMEAADPTLAASTERARALEAEAAQAQQAGDQAKLQQLAAEAQGLQMRFMEAQAKALEQPELAARVEAFETHLERKMVEVDPEATTLIERYEELGAKIEGAMQGPSSR